MREIHGADSNRPTDELAAVESGTLFTGGAPLGLQSRLGLVAPGNLGIRRRMVMFVIVTCVPLLVLTAIESSGSFRSFISDFGTLARCLVAGPLLIAAEGTCIAGLGKIARHLHEMHFVPDAEVPRFRQAVASTLQWREARPVEILVALAAFAISVASTQLVSASEVPAWHHAESGALSPAGWWHALVSMPLLLMLILGMLWRLVVWTRFLLLVSRLDLELIPAHPDKAAGMGFVGYSVRAFCPAGAALGAIVAGAVAQHVIHQGASLLDYKYLVGGLVVVAVILFTAPLLAFTSRLIMTRRQGISRYGQLANELGRQFERKWFRPRREPTDMLEQSDFSAAADLYAVVNTVHELKPVPIDLASIAMLVAATLAPLVPVVLGVVPFDVVVSTVLGLLH